MVAKRTLFPSSSSRKRRRKALPPQYSGARPELQYFTTQFLTNTAATNVLSGIIRGSSRGQRTGDVIRIKKIVYTVPPLTGAVGCKAYMYSRNGNASKTLPTSVGNSPTGTPDIKNFRVWSSVNHAMNANFLSTLSVTGGTSLSPGTKLTKNFTIPMKVTFDNSTDLTEQENGVYVDVRSYTDDLTLNPAVYTNQLPGNVEVWYYDA